MLTLKAAAATIRLRELRFMLSITSTLKIGSIGSDNYRTHEGWRIKVA
ncbi:MAG: hypothetical protein WCO31_06315 [Actinomycetes bacterium]